MPKTPEPVLTDSLIAWYRGHHRDLPWRAAPGHTADPYRVWLSEIMLQQTTVKAVIPYFFKFLELWPSVTSLAKAPVEHILDAWAGLGYYARARNLHKCAQVITDQHGGRFPDTYDGLLTLPGIGPYTAGAITTIAFQKVAPVMDGNIERVVGRLYAIDAPLPNGKPLYAEKVAALFHNQLNAPGDLAQAMMDLGATICTPTSPNCMICPVSAHCTARAQGTQESYPKKAPKGVLPEKHGYVYWISNDKGEILTERRGETGMLARMRGLPTSDWVDRQETLRPLQGLQANDTGHEVRHVFTHFGLTLTIMAGSIHSLEIPANMQFVAPDRDWQDSLPTLFRKVAKLMR
jgi:A/G-specific adenine glycosylase